MESRHDPRPRGSSRNLGRDHRSVLGAQRISDLTLLAHPDSTHELDTFIDAASEWPGRPEDGAIFEEGILAAARDLVQG
jgi:hypothetical protein